MKKIVTIVLIVIHFWGGLVAQTYLETNFEDAKIPDTWTQEFVQQTIEWKCRTGVGTGSHPPTTAYEGNYNASFYVNSLNSTKTKLITNEFDIEDATKPELHFRYAQYFYADPFGEGNAKLTVYYRSVLDGIGWTKLKDFDEPTTDWKEGVILIPDTAHFGAIQLAFEGRIDDGNQHGLCIDSVRVIETGIIPKSIKSITASQASTDLIPTGSINNPILRLKFTVTGNNGILELNDLTVTPLLNSLEVVPSNGVKLFTTLSSRFNDTTSLGSPISFQNGQATFTNLGYNLPIGESYVWICFDVPTDANHLFKNKNVDAAILANDIKVNGTYYTETDLNPDGIRSISESLFYDSFEGGTNWTLTPEFEHEKPIGKGGTYGKSDPTFARSGFKVMGVDLTGIGTYKGDYEKNLGSNAYKATINATLDATFYKNLNLQFYRWLNVYFTDSARIDISLDGGLTYQNIWTNTGTYSDNQWFFQQVSLAYLADRQDDIKFRFTLGPTGSFYPYSGWNIDNFAITGTYIENDASVTELTAPNEGCGHVAPEVLKVKVKNLGSNALPNKFPIGYSTDGGSSWVMDTVRTILQPNDEIEFPFSQLVDFTSPGNYTLKIRTFLPNDEYEINDEVDTSLYSSPTFSMPYFENFETNNGYWLLGGVNETWEYGNPNASVMNKAYSGTKCWATNLDGNYPNNDSAWLESPCFDFTGIDKPILDFMLFTKAELNNDGLAIYYTINNGSSWELVTTEGSYYWNWYNNSTITSFGHEGWDSVTNNWFKARQILPNDIADEPLVKFRFLFMSNSSDSSEGFAIDDIRFYNAPTDAGVDSIIAPVTSCNLSKTQAITLSIKNFGIRPISTTDTIFAKVIINETTTLTDTFLTSTPIAINDTAHFTFKTKVDMFDKKWYKLKAYTEVKGDTAYYVAGVYNDTIIDSAYVNGEPYYTLGPNIGILDANTVNLDGKVRSVGGANFDSYNWKFAHNDSLATGRMLDVPAYPSGKDSLVISIAVEINPTCFAFDTIEIINSNTDMGIFSIAGIGDKCFNGQNQNLVATIRNYASVKVDAGTDIKVGFKLGEDANEEAHIETITLAKDLLTGEDTVYTFLQNPVYNLSGTFTFSVFTIVNVDLDYGNDTLPQAVEIYPLPEVELGADSVLTLSANGTVLDAGLSSPGNTYEWQDNSTLQTLTITNDLSNIYSVTVTDAQTCSTASDAVRIVSDNWVLDSLISPINACTATSNEQISVLLINKSPNTYSIGYQIPAQINFNGTLTNTTISLPGTLLPFDSIDYTFASVFNMTTAKDYSINVKINPSHDINRLDNELDETVNVWGIYPVNLGADTIVTKRADTIQLNAGAGYYTYIWSDASTNNYLNIPVKNSDTYSVTVTSLHGCSNSTDDVTIMAYDMGITEIVTPQSRCELTGTNRIKLIVENFGIDDIPANEDIKFYYRFNNGAWVEKPYTTSFIIATGETAEILLYENIVFDSETTYDMDMYMDWDKDFYPTNDTRSKSILQYDKPIVNFGDDILTKTPDTVFIDGGANHTTYLWQNGYTGQIFDVTYNYASVYSVTVTNTNGCSASDTVNIYTYDISIPSMVSLDACDTASNFKPSFTLKLNSTDTLLAGTVIKAKYKFGETEVSEYITLSDPLYTGGTIPYTFTTPFTVSDTGSYSITCSVEMTNEADTTNNSLESNFRIGAYPVKLGNDRVSNQSSVLLDAGAGYASYIWNDASVNRTLTVTSTGTYKVTAIDALGCKANDSIHVLFLHPNYQIIEIKGLSDNCSHGNTESILFDLKNAGNDTTHSASKIPISYRINNGTAVTEFYTFTSNFLPGDTVTVDFDSIPNLSESGVYDILVTSTLANTTISKDTSINTWGYPDVSLGNNIETTNDEVVLNAGEDFASYLWSTSDTTQTISVSSNGDYWVEVSNSAGCKNSDTVNVFFVPTSLYVSEFVRPLTACGTLSNEDVTIKVKNGSSKTVPAGTLVILGYQLDGQDRVNENNVLENGMPSNITLEYTFTNKLNSSSSGNTNITFYVRVDEKDLDTAEYEISVYEKPLFFGGEDTIFVSSYPYELDAEVEAESYLWNTDVTTPTLTVNADGAYWLKITEENDCEFTDTVFVDNITGISDSWSNQIEVYPNPGESEISVNLPKNIGKVNLHITDLQGKLVFVKKDVSDNLKLDISKWEQGAYILRISNGEQFGVYRIVKQ